MVGGVQGVRGIGAPARAYASANSRSSFNPRRRGGMDESVAGMSGRFHATPRRARDMHGGDSLYATSPMQEAAFPNTSWSAVFTARAGGDATGAHAALSRLCQQYWYPLYAFARRWGLDPEDAEDATQSFFVALESAGLLASADPSRGKLRTFFLAAFQRDLNDFRKAANRDKRGGGNVVSLDRLAAEERLAAEPAAPPAQSFEREWALDVLDAAVARLERNYGATGRADHFTVLRPFLTDEADYDELCAKLSLNPDAARQAVHRLRERLGRALRDEIADTLFKPTDATVDEELAALRAILAR
jgi:RNA polymerase sigma factor (sigma-70 family)